MSVSTTTTILIVDETPDNLRLLTKILESQDYDVRKALNGRMALQCVDRYRLDLILLDINTPEINGYEVCQQLKASEWTADIPIIFTSALERLEDKVQAFELGGVDLITKPFQEQEVLMRVKNQLLIQQQRQELSSLTYILEQEIEARSWAEAEIKRLSLTDKLTGLYNRRGFFLLGEQHLKMARRTQTPYCLLCADLDGLKKINDTLGRAMGDKALVDTAEIFKQTFHDADLAARLGGDEFVLFLHTSPDNLDNFYLRLQASIDSFNQQSNQPYLLSISLGVQPGDLNKNFSLKQIVAQADKLMYEHKHAKRGLNC